MHLWCSSMLMLSQLLSAWKMSTLISILRPGGWSLLNQRVTIHYNYIGAFETPDYRNILERDILLERRKDVALSYAPHRLPYNFGNKNTEYHQQTFSDTLMILRMERTVKIDILG